MEIQPLAYMLEDLLHEASDDGLEVSLARTVWADQDDPDAVKEEYAQRYRRAVLAVTEQRGGPLFAGGPLDVGYPDWLRTEHVTCWSHAAGVIYVGLSSTDDELLVVAGARPHPVEREAITLLPPAD